MINSKVHRISLGQVIVAIYIWHAAPVLPELYEALASVLNQDPLSFVSGSTTIIRRETANAAKEMASAR